MFPHRPYRSSLHALPKRRSSGLGFLYSSVTLIIFYQEMAKKVNYICYLFDINLLYLRYIFAILKQDQIYFHIMLRCELLYGLLSHSHGFIFRVTIYPGGYQRKGNRAAPFSPRLFHGAGISAAQQFFFSITAAVPYRPHCMDDISGRQSISVRYHCLTCRTWSQLPAILLQFVRRGCSEYGATHSATSRQLRVGCVDDRVGLHLCYVAFHLFKCHTALLSYPTDNS